MNGRPPIYARSMTATTTTTPAYSSIDANLSTKDNDGDDDVEVGDGTIVGGSDASLAISLSRSIRNDS